MDVRPPLGGKGRLDACQFEPRFSGTKSAKDLHCSCPWQACPASRRNFTEYRTTLHSTHTHGGKFVERTEGAEPLSCARRISWIFPHRSENHDRSHASDSCASERHRPSRGWR